MGWNSVEARVWPSCTRHRCVDVWPLNLPFDDPVTCCLGSKRNKKHSQAGLGSVASRYQVSEQIAAVNWDQSLLMERIKARWQAKALAPPRNKALKNLKKNSFRLNWLCLRWFWNGCFYWTCCFRMSTNLQASSLRRVQLLSSSVAWIP